MSESTKNKNSKDEEIDLSDLFRRLRKSIIRLLKVTGRGSLITLSFLIRKWLPLSLSIILGIGASCLMKVSSPSIYTSDLIIKSNAVPNADMMTHIDKLNKFCAENNRPALAQALSLEPDQIKNIIDIKSYWIIDMANDGIPDYIDANEIHTPYDTLNTKMSDRMAIRAKITSATMLLTLQDGLISYITKDSLFQQKNRIRLKQTSDLLSMLNYDITQLDSLQKIKYFEETKNLRSKTGGQMVFLQEQKTQLVYPDKYNLNEKKQLLETEQDLYKDIVTVLSEFSLPAKRDNGTLFYGKYLIPAFFLFTLLILVIISNFKKLDEILRRY
jgi:hypothetical protein